MKYACLLAVCAAATWAQAPPTTPANSVTAAPAAAVANPSPPATAATLAPPAPPAAPKPDEVRSAMADSLVKQRASVIKQVASVMGKTPTPAASFFTVPWVESPVPFSVPPCDPMPAAQLDKLIEESSQQTGLKPDLVRAVIDQESGARPCAVSWKGAQGLMQLMPETAGSFGVRDPFDPRQNIEAGTKLLKQLLTKYNNDVSLALAAYNAGEGRVDKEGGVPQIPETVNYVNSIQSKLPEKQPTQAPASGKP
jgi:hypothetical protein